MVCATARVPRAETLLPDRDRQTIMGSRTPLTSKGRAMRARIVEIAADQAFRTGAREATLDEVREQAGASKSQIYHYFSSKDELISAVIELQGQRTIDAQMPELGVVDSLPSLRSWCRKLVRIAGDHGTVGGCPIGSLANEFGGAEGPHATALADQLEAWRGAIEDAFARMRQQGALRADADPHALSVLFLSTIQGALLLTKVSKSPDPLDKALGQLLALIDCPSRTGA